MATSSVHQETVSNQHSPQCNQKRCYAHRLYVESPGDDLQPTTSRATPASEGGGKKKHPLEIILKTTKSFLGTNFNSSLKSLLMHLPFFSPQSFTVHTFCGGGGTGTGTVRGTGIVFTFVKYLSCIMIWGTGTAADAEQKRICPWQKTEKVCLLAKRMVSKLLLCQALWANNLLCGFPEAPGNSLDHTATWAFHHNPPSQMFNLLSN